MFLVFYPQAAVDWLRDFPIAGQLLQLQTLMAGKEVHFVDVMALGMGTAAVAAPLLAFAANRLHRDEIIYGN